jgi:hypothetical protein
MVSSDVVRRAIEQIRKRRVNYEYFFEKLDSPDWIEPLLKEGFFGSPEPAKREGEWISFPIWPESRYLVRMALKAPELVLPVIMKIPETNNVRVHEDLAQAALAMPPELAAKWAQKEARWVSKQDYLYFLLPEKLGQVVAHLAEANEIDTALALARALLKLKPDPWTEEKGLLPRPRARCDWWLYGKVVKDVATALVDAAGMRAFGLLCELLEDAVRLSRRRKESVPPADYSFVWREAIESEREVEDDVTNILVSAVRDAAERIAEKEQGSVPELVRKLESHSWHIFCRIALHLLRKYAKSAPEMVSERLSNRELFDEIGVRREYFLLQRECFAMVGPREMGNIFSWIEQGPDPERFKDSIEQWSGKRPSDEEAEKYRKKWQLERLSPIKEFLPENWKKVYEELAKEYGEPQHPDLPVHYESWSGPTSPKTVAELKQMGVDSVLQFLKTWQGPEEGHFEPDKVGLGRVLQGVVKDECVAYAKVAPNLAVEDVAPVYAYHFLEGLREAWKEGKTFDWDPVIGMCESVVEKPDHSKWRLPRKAIADLFQEALRDDKHRIPDEFLPRVKRILLSDLVYDEEPTEEHEAKYGGTNMDPATLAINTVRGSAIEALIYYAMTIARSQLAKNETPHLEEDVRRVFTEKVVDKTKEPSQAVHSLFGYFFPYLHFCDKEWAETHVKDIFPAEEEKEKYWDAAWSSYVCFNRVWGLVFKILKAEYERAIRDMGRGKVWRGIGESANNRLAEHIAVLYWWGEIKIGDDLFTLFYQSAPADVRGHVIWFLGDVLADQSEDVRKEKWPLLRGLWEERVSAERKGEKKENLVKELPHFAGWATACPEPLVDMVSLLKAVVPYYGQYDISVGDVLDYLNRECAKYPNESMMILSALKESPALMSLAGYKDEQIRSVLKSVMKKGSDATRRLADDFVNNLAAKGYYAFRDLLRLP